MTLGHTNFHQHTVWFLKNPLYRLTKKIIADNHLNIVHTLHVQIEEPCVWVLVPDQKRRRRMEDEEASLPPLPFSSYRPPAAEDAAPAAITLLLRCWEVNILKN